MLACGRYLQLYRCKESAVKEAKAAYANGEVWFYPGTETPMPLTMAIMQAEMAPAQRLAELERYMGTRKTSLWNQRRAEVDQERLREREAMTEAILAKRSASGWSALETAQALELKSLKLPRSLELEVAREVSFIEPITDTDGGISDAELEAQSRAYMAKQKEIVEVWLPNRRAEVAAAVTAEAARQNSELIDEDDFNPLSDEISDTGWDEDGETLTEVAEEWA
jgi:hypothetical protein